jgi:EAL domain-containing protein (putative c-di-GMP-specific phosphodiesterase class I)/CheY-like chemotaxis protein
VTDEQTQLHTDNPDGSPKVPAEAPRTPLCLIVDDDANVRHGLSVILHGSGFDTEEFEDGIAMRASLKRRSPDLIFLDVGLQFTDTIETLATLGNSSFFGVVQLMSNRGGAVLERMKAVGQQHKLHMLPVLKKPLETSAIIALLQELKLGHAAPLAGRVRLDEALANGWIEFWYQPKIDLRKKQLAGVEIFARANHPRFGVLPPSAFMPGATETEVAELSQKAIVCALQGGLTLSKLGVALRFAVNIPVEQLAKLDVAAIIRAHRPQHDQWPGLIIDVIEGEVVTNLPLVIDLAKALANVNVKLAIDHFGRSISALARFKTLPFAEFKLDRPFVSACGSDKVKAPLCRTVIDLAHSLGSAAVAIGIEKASDALALTSMGCNLGQGFLLGQPMPPERFLSLMRQRLAGQGRPAPAVAAAAAP